MPEEIPKAEREIEITDDMALAGAKVIQAAFFEVIPFETSALGTAREVFEAMNAARKG